MDIPKAVEVGQWRQMAAHTEPGPDRGFCLVGSSFSLLLKVLAHGGTVGIVLWSLYIKEPRPALFSIFEVNIAP